MQSATTINGKTMKNENHQQNKEYFVDLHIFRMIAVAIIIRIYMMNYISSFVLSEKKRKDND